MKGFKCFLSAVLTVALTSLALASCAGAHSKREYRLDASGWTTQCFGRFLIDLPADAQFTQIYELESTPIKPAPEMKVTDIATSLATRERQLKAEPHRTRGQMFVRTAQFQNGSAAVVGWSAPFSTALMNLEGWLVAQGSNAVYKFFPEISPRTPEVAIGIVDDLSRNLYSLDAGQLPPRGIQAFCIDGAYLKGNEFRSESMNITVRLPEHPGMVFTLSSITAGEVDETLMQRMGHFGSGILQYAAGIRTLRKGDRSINGIKAQEYLVTATEDGQRHYTFTFENLYKAESVAEPQLNAGLHAEGKTDQAPAFTDDAQALQLWDALIGSIRPLPGSRDAPPPPPRDPPLPLESFEQREHNRRLLDRFIATGEWLPPDGRREP